jgi:hypothetical protein
MKHASPSKQKQQGGYRAISTEAFLQGRLEPHEKSLEQQAAKGDVMAQAFLRANKRLRAQGKIT